MSAFPATTQEASTPVPSSTTATAPSATAARTFAIALRGESALSRRLMRIRTGPSGVSKEPATRRAELGAARDRVATYGVLENGALTTTVTVRASPESALPPPQAGRSRRNASAASVRRRTNLAWVGRASSEIGLADGRVPRHVVGGSGGEPAPGVEDDDLLGDRADEAEVVLDDEHGEAAGRGGRRGSAPAGRGPRRRRPPTARRAGAPSAPPRGRRPPSGAAAPRSSASRPARRVAPRAPRPAARRARGRGRRRRPGGPSAWRGARAVPRGGARAAMRRRPRSRGP